MLIDYIWDKGEQFQKFSQTSRTFPFYSNRNRLLNHEVNYWARLGSWPKSKCCINVSYDMLGEKKKKKKASYLQSSRAHYHASESPAPWSLHACPPAPPPLPTVCVYVYTCVWGHRSTCFWYMYRVLKVNNERFFHRTLTEFWASKKWSSLPRRSRLDTTSSCFSTRQGSWIKRSRNTVYKHCKTGVQ